MKQSVRAQVIERRTYLRPLDKDGTVFETVDQAWDRVVGHQRWLWERAQGAALNAEQEAELEELRQLFLQRKVTVSGRTRWLGGTDIAKERQASQFNCSFGVVQTVHDVVDTIWLLLQGCGVGFSANVGVLNGFVAPIAELEIIRSTKTLPIDMNGNPVSDPALKGDPKNRETFDKATGVWTIRVGDSAEAWAKFFGKLLAFKQHAKKLVVDFSEIRPAGYRLSGYGWISSGDNQITKAVEGIFEVMNRSAGKLLTAIDILDIENHLGTILSSRRSAEIALYPFDGTEIDAFISAKKDNYSYFVRSTKASIRAEPNDAAEVVKVVNQGTALYANMEKRKDVIKNGYVQVVDETWTPMGWASLTEVKKDRVHRQMSNNSILFHQKPTRRQLKNVFKQIAAAGGSEPGFINANAAQRRAPYFKGVNPCAEILLGDKSFCNLVETAVCRFNGDEAALHRAHRIIARANYRQTCVDLRDGILQHTWHELNDFLHLCGVGVTGVVGWEFVDDAEAWQELRAVAVEGANSMADELGLPRPQMVTTVKPSGTQTKVFGCEGDEIGEGVHKPLGRYIFNNVNFSKDDPLIKVLEKANYRITVNPSDDTGRIVTLPVEFQNVAFDKVTRKMKRTKMVEVEEGYQPVVGELMLMPNKVVREVEEDVEIEVNLESAITQLERYKMLQNNYVDHNCSITVSYDIDEVPEIIDWLLDNWDSYVGVAFLYRNDPTKTAADLGYAYLPQEVVDAKTYNDYVSTLLPVDLNGTDSEEMVQIEECTSGGCPIR